MATPKAQHEYQHYIPRFILRNFAHGKIKLKKGKQDDLVFVISLPDQSCQAGPVGRVCGATNLYYNKEDQDPMNIEKLFSELESRTSQIFAKICTAIANGKDHIEILEKHIHTLFKFMILSLRRSESYRDMVKNPHRENDFMFQSKFREAKKQGRSGDPEQWWLEELLYVLESDHERLIQDASENTSETSAATYKEFVDNYALQIWKAAPGHEFFLNESLVDFEGDTQSNLGVKKGESGDHLIWMTTENFNHLILPISPVVALVFCREASCWTSPFATYFHQAKIPFPEKSSLAKAPHKDIAFVDKPKEKRRKKNYPATTAWRVSIGTLDRQHHHIINSYALAHAKSVVVVRTPELFEQAKKDMEIFSQDRKESWKKDGFRFDEQTLGPSCPKQASSAPVSEYTECNEEILDLFFDPLMELMMEFDNNPEPLLRTKANALRSWKAMHAVEIWGKLQDPTTQKSAETTDIRFMPPELVAALKASYPPKPPNHEELRELNFAKFIEIALGEEIFVKISFEISVKIKEVLDGMESSKGAGSSIDAGEPNRTCSCVSCEKGGTECFIQNPGFQSMVGSASELEVLRWMFEERQDILAPLIRKFSVPLEDIKSTGIRIRARKE